MKQVIGNATLYLGDSNEILADISNADAVVTDPPYGLSFMGKQWDYDVPTRELWERVYQSIKPGGHLLSFFGSRTYHRGVIPIEDAGFDIRDQLMWLYGSGFPKSHNIGKAVDELEGNDRSVLKEKIKKDLFEGEKEIFIERKTKDFSHHKGSMMSKDTTKNFDTKTIAVNITKGNSEWEGWGTALKPAHEPIVMARKPFKGTVAENVLEHGTGGINIDECRVDYVSDYDKKHQADIARGQDNANNGVFFGGKGKTKASSHEPTGRFPANVMHDGSEEVLEIFPETGKSTAGRYFYCAKASKQDRDKDNNHPTVKPTELMRYLCRLVTPKGGVVLDPFMGSGSTGKGALLEGFKFVGIEMDRDYFDIACARLEAVQKNVQTGLF